MNTKDPADRDLAVAALKWVMCSFRPLTLEFLVYLLARKDRGTKRHYLTEGYLLTICKNFILADKSDVVQFSHDTVRDWLNIQKSTTDDEMEYSPARAHAQAAETCLLHFSEIDFRPRSPTNRYTFYNNFYITVDWPSHCEKASTQRGKGLLKTLFTDLVLTDNGNSQLIRWLKGWSRIFDSTLWVDRVPVSTRERLVSAFPGPFHLACIFGFHEALRNVSNFNTTTVERGLLLAVRYGHCDIVRALLDDGLNINSDGLLEEALKQNHNQIIELLFRRGVDVNIGEPLAAASGSGNERIVQLLLERVEDINKGAPLEAASSNGHEKIVQILLEKGVDVSVGWPLVEASRQGYEEIVQLLLGTEVDIDEGTPLAVASRNGHRRIVQILLDKEADVNAGNPLGMAIGYGHEDIAKMLLDKGADVNQGGLLVTAIKSGNVQIVKQLLKKGVDPNITGGSYGFTPLKEASRDGNLLFVKLLLDQGARINDGRIVDGTALLSASYEGFEPIARLLLENGAEIRSENLALAASQGHADIVRLLLQYGAEVNDQGTYGTALVDASRVGHEQVVEVLLEYKANINAQGVHGTALHQASSGGNEKMVRFLLGNGADASIQRVDTGKIAWQEALDSGHEKIAQLLATATSNLAKMV
jgi:ankyrin repeat protein